MISINFWQLLTVVLLLLKCVLSMSVTWWQVLLPLAVHLSIRAEMQYRQRKAGKRLPATWWLQ